MRNVSLRILSITGVIFLSSFSSCKKDENEPLPEPAISSFSPISGSVGKTVTITGTNFGTTEGSSIVMFNGTTAEVTSHSATDVLAVVPEGATTGPITLTVGDKTATSTGNFTVLPSVADDPDFYFGSDLSYVNQILDHGGVYKDDNAVKNPYQIFKEHGNDLVRLRIWHNPAWTKEVYDPDGDQLYNDLFDVEEAIVRSKEQGMKVLLDFHYSDFWTDPGRQEIPAAWLNIKDINVLRDSVYNYTFKTLKYLDNKGLLPEFVQIGNETNCGMMYEYDETPVTGFPASNVCSRDEWANLRTVINSGIKAVRDVSAASAIKTKIILHVADPVNIDWWFDNVTSGGVVSDFEIIGFSYYPIWHTGVSVADLSDRVAGFKSKYGKDIMILETAYPWTNTGNDSYGNIFGGQTPISGFPYSQQGQFDMMKTITQELIDGGGIGIVYWEPAWITSQLRDFWNTGSSWENSALFDYNGNAIIGMDYMTHAYDR
jgi:arabinogalactan endo-1,4-beta-galactosidase